MINTDEKIKIKGLKNLKNLKKLNPEGEKNIEGSNEFKVNDYIALKLEYVKGDIDVITGWSTVIYVKGKRFKQCKYLLLNIHIDDISSFDKIQSIDEAEEMMRSLKKNENNSYLEDYEDDESVEKIPPEVEFWGHCSNMQVWYESNYNTRLLHRWLAFPLLKELTEAGDPIAKKVFKEEIAKRYASGHPSVVKSLKNGGFMDYLTPEEIGAIIDDLKSKEVKNEYVTYKGRVCEFVLNGKLDLQDCGINDITDIEGLDSLRDLKDLDLSHNQISEIKGLENLENLKWLWLNDNQISEIKGLENLEHLDHLILRNNQITEIKGLEKLTNLVSVTLDNNQITKIKGLKNLRNLKFLNINDNQISEVEGLESLNKLKNLGLASNLIPTKIIEELGGLDSLGGVKIAQNFVNYCKKNLK